MDRRKIITTIVCRICLRLGNRLKTKDFDENLTQLHDEICDFDVFEAPILSFCTICEHQLRKFYNFKQKCRRAHLILKAKKTELKKKNMLIIEHLHKQLPPDSIGYLTAGARQGVFYYFPDFNEPSLIPQNLQVNVSAESELLKEEPIDFDYDTDSNLDAHNTTDDTETVPKPDLEDSLSLSNDNRRDDDNSQVIDYEETQLEEEDPLFKYLKKHFPERSNVKNSKTETSTPKKSLKGILTKENVCKMKTTKAEKHVTKAEREKLQFKEKVLHLIEEGNLNLGEDVTLTKEQFLEMFEKSNYNRRSYGVLLKQGFKDPAKLKSFVQHLFRRFNPEYETVFDIEYLPTRDSKLAQFRARKDNDHYLKAEFKCHKCYNWFDNKSMLDYHSKWHDPNRQYACDICSMRFLSRKQRTNHMNMVHTAVYQCKLCDVLTYHFGTMKNHYDQHRGVKYICDVCPAEFRSNSALNTHRKTHATYQCPHCPNLFLNKKGLQYHNRLKHPNAPPAPAPTSESCVECDETESRDPALPCTHQREVHTTPKARFKCQPTCDLTFKTALDLREHIRSTKHRQVWPSTSWGSKAGFKQKPKVTGPHEPFRTCPICQEQVPNNSKRALYLHHSIKHPTAAYTFVNAKNHLCEHCGKSFLAHSIYLDHLHTHTGERPHACPECPARFHLRNQLLLHRHRHRPPRYECDVCGKKFITTTNLAVHKRIHIGDRRYKCDICFKGFLHSTSLKEHINGVHNQVRKVRNRKATRKLKKEC